MAGYAMGAHMAYVYIRGEYWEPLERLQAAIHEARAAGVAWVRCAGTGWAFDVEITRGGRGLHLRRRDGDAGVSGGEEGDAAP